MGMSAENAVYKPTNSIFKPLNPRSPKKEVKLEEFFCDLAKPF
jgi:hypothetical protein